LTQHHRRRGRGEPDDPDELGALPPDEGGGAEYDPDVPDGVEGVVL